MNMKTERDAVQSELTRQDTILAQIDAAVAGRAATRLQMVKDHEAACKAFDAETAAKTAERNSIAGVKSAAATVLTKIDEAIAAVEQAAVKPELIEK
jgi:hypothetical protein